MKIKIRNFQKKDQTQIRRLITSILRREFGIDELTYPESDLNNIAAAYGGKRDLFLIASAGNIIVGTVAIKEDFNNTALLRRVFVAPEFRGVGLGKELLIRAIEFCQKKKYRLIIFRSTDMMKAANMLCRNNGFKIRADMSLGGVKLLKSVRRLRAAKR